MAPEVLKGKYDQKCDIWSCGVICYILLCGYPPFNDRNDHVIVEKIKKGEFEFPHEEWGNVSGEAKDFVRKLLTIEPESRPSATDALKHPWILKRRKTDNLNNPQSEKALLNLRTFRADRKIQQATWVYLVSYLSTREEKNELMKTFKALDLNGDGQLSRDELIAGYEKIMAPKEAEREVDNIMATVDTNKSGYIDYSGFYLLNFYFP
jgi:calcium-dependent protein kinase